MITSETLTDDMIRALRDGPEGILSDQLRDICRIALQRGTPTGLHPFCRVCSWRKGGRDSWDGHRCKCKFYAPEYHRCDICGGVGTVPYDVGTQPCPSCDGSGLVDMTEVSAARMHIVYHLNTLPNQI